MGESCIASPSFQREKCIFSCVKCLHTRVGSLSSCTACRVNMEAQLLCCCSDAGHTLGVIGTIVVADKPREVRVLCMLFTRRALRSVAICRLVHRKVLTQHATRFVRRTLDNCDRFSVGRDIIEEDDSSATYATQLNKSSRLFKCRALFSKIEVCRRNVSRLLQQLEKRVNLMRARPLVTRCNLPVPHSYNHEFGTRV